MQPPGCAKAQSDFPTAAAAPETDKARPWLFAFLIAPDAVISLGLVSGALSYLLRNEGVEPARAASIVALLALPHAIYFLWGPLTDFWLPRRAWLISSAIAAAALLGIAFHQPRLGATRTIAIIFAGACLGEFVVAACGGIMGTLRSEVNRRRAGSAYQTGSLVFGAVTVFLMVWLAERVSLARLGWIVAAMIALPALAVFAAPGGEPASRATAAASPLRTAARIWREFRSTFLRREAIPYTLMCAFPASSGAMIGLLPELARDYGVSGAQVAWINGLGGALLTAAGAMAVSLIPVRVRTPIAFLTAGIVNAGTLAILALGSLRPAVYFTGTVLFLFTIGGCYALFTGVVLEFMGDSGMSGSSRYAIINSIGNLPVAYMAWINGQGFRLWGPRGMPGADAALSATGALLILGFFFRGRSGIAPAC
ncbi:MAG TPA: MFS transporter [Terracidiphilus sp.]|nr:MFS transporter [Terracidiphilus sp.]